MQPPVTSASPRRAPGRVAVRMDGIFLARPDPLPEDGMQMAVKDLFDTAGLPTTYGSILFADHVPEHSAMAVTQLEDAGYANVGKTNLHEFAYGVTSQNPHFGTVPNPAAPGRTAGGSSGGSAAALAAGCADVGLKPTFGVVSLEGVFPLAPTFDHAGPMARTVESCVRMMEVFVPGFSLPDSIDARVGIAWLEQCEPLVCERVGEAGARLGAEAVDFPLPDNVGPAFMREVADVHRDLFAEHADAYGDNVRGKIERGPAATETEYQAATRRRDEYRERCEAEIADFNLLLVPTLGFEPPPADVDEIEVREAMIRFTLPFNALGWPALSIPMGDASVQIVGRPGEDALVLAAGASLERGARKT